MPRWAARPVVEGHARAGRIGDSSPDDRGVPDQAAQGNNRTGGNERPWLIRIEAATPVRSNPKIDSTTGAAQILLPQNTEFITGLSQHRGVLWAMVNSTTGPVYQVDLATGALTLMFAPTSRGSTAVSRELALLALAPARCEAS